MVKTSPKQIGDFFMPFLSVFQKRSLSIGDETIHLSRKRKGMWACLLENGAY